MLCGRYVLRSALRGRYDFSETGTLFFLKAITPILQMCVCVVEWAYTQGVAQRRTL